MIRKFFGSTVKKADIIPDPSVILSYDFNDDKPGVITDKSGYGNHGILTNPENTSYVAGLDGLAIFMDTNVPVANRSRIIIPTSPSLQSLASSFTLDLSIKRPNEAVDFRDIFTTAPPGSGQYGFNLAVQEATGRLHSYLSYEIYGNAYRVTSHSSRTINYTEYTRITLTYDSSEIIIYFDKVNAANNSGTVAEGVNVQSLVDWIIYAQSYNHVKVYNKALSPEEVEDLEDLNEDHSPLKRVYVDGINYSASIDGADIIPAPRDVMRYVQSPTGLRPSNFAWWDESSTPGPYCNGFAFFRADCLFPTHTSSVTTMRVETASSNPYIRRADEVLYSFSVYTPLDYMIEELGEIIHQWHGWPGSPNVSFRRINGRFCFQIWIAGGYENHQVFDVGPIPPQGQWANFEVYVKFSDDNDGRLTVWRDKKLARLYNPVNRQMWVVPHQSDISTGANLSYRIKNDLGDVSQVVDNGEVVSVLDWTGKTSQPGNVSNSNKYPKFGIYKSSVTNRYVTGSNEILPGWNDPESALYLPPESRIVSVGIGNVNFETRLDKRSHTDAYKSINVDRSTPIEVPSWWID